MNGEDKQLSDEMLSFVTEIVDKWMQGLCRLSDSNITEKARKEGRIIITFDRTSATLWRPPVRQLQVSLS